MDKVTTYLKVAGIITILGSLLFISLPVILVIFVLIGLYLLFVGTRSLNEMYKHRVPLLIVGILLCFTNVISGVFTVIAYDQLENMKRNGIKAPPKKKEKVDKEARKIDILLKLGVAMVFIAGILFATTSWEIITNQVKLIVLLALAILFLGLSIFSEKRIKIKNTTKMYWLLSMSFFIVATIGLFYYGVINNYLTYSGEGSDIALSITFLVAAIISALTAHKFDNNFFRYTTYITLFAAVDFASSIFGDFVSSLFVIAYILFFTTMLLIFDKEKPITKFSKVMIYLLPICIIALVGEVNNLVLLSYAGLNSVSLIIVAKKGNFADKVIPYMLIFLIILYTIYSYSIPYREALVISFTSLISIINRLKLLDDSKASRITTSIMNAILAFILFIIAIISNPYTALIVAIIYLLYNLVCGINYFKDNSGKLELYMQPISVLYFVMSTLYLINCTVLPITFIQFAAILALVYGIIHFSIRYNVHRIEYFVFTVSTIIFTALCNLIDADPVSNILLLVPTIYLVVFYNKRSNVIRNWLYIVLLFIIEALFVSSKVLGTSPIINTIVVLWIFAMLLVVLFNNKQLRMINYFAIIVPLYSLFTVCQTDIIYSKIMISVLEFYCLYLFLFYLITPKEAKNIIAIMGISLIVLPIFFIPNIIIGIYLGVIGISLISLSFLYKDYNSLFWVGLVITILNIIYQLKGLWTQLPFWLYLLICGLGIIAFVTYKELKNTKKKSTK